MQYCCGVFIFSFFIGLVSAVPLQVLEPGLFKRELSASSKGESKAMMVEFGARGQLIVSSKKSKLEVRKTFYDGSELIGFTVSGMDGRAEIASFKIIDSFLLKSRIGERSAYWRSSGGGKLISNETQASRAQASVVVSYALHSPRKATSSFSTQCTRNLRYFLKHGVLSAQHGVHFVFNLVGDTPNFLALAQLASNQSNVEIKRHDNMVIDLFIQGEVIREFLGATKRTEHFICLNCGARGPYFPALADAPPSVWTTAFTSRMNERVKAVGSSISCEQARHIQTFVIAFHRDGAKLASDLWTSAVHGTKRGENKLALISEFEVGLGAKFTSYGYAIASLGADCNESSVAKEMSLNPFNCLKSNETTEGMHGSIGCEGVEPCKVVFVKFGGEVLREGFLPQQTLLRVTRDEETSCGRFPLRPERAKYDFPRILDRICLPPSMPQSISDGWMCKDVVDADFVVLIRSHLGYLHHTLSMLYNFEAQLSSQNKSSAPTVFVGIIPLEVGIWQEIDESVQKRFVGGRKVTVRTLPFPSWVYKDYANELKVLCNDSYLQRLKDEHSAYDISRYCGIDSPKHYFLVDVAMEWLRRQCRSCGFLLVTNGDNIYSYQFFPQVAGSALASNQSDIIYFDYVHKNAAQNNAMLQRSSTDLGAYLVRFDLIKLHNLTFLGALPDRVTAGHYHDADGHFIESALKMGDINFTKISKLLYYHE